MIRRWSKVVYDRLQSNHHDKFIGIRWSVAVAPANAQNLLGSDARASRLETFAVWYSWKVVYRRLQSYTRASSLKMLRFVVHMKSL